MFPVQLPEVPAHLVAQRVPVLGPVVGGGRQELGHFLGGGGQQRPGDATKQRRQPLRGLRAGQQERQLAGTVAGQVTGGGRDPPPDRGATIRWGSFETTAQLGQQRIGMPVGQGGQVRHQVAQFGHVIRDGLGVAGDQQPGAFPVGEGRRQQRRRKFVMAFVDDPAAKASPLPDRPGGVVGGEDLRVLHPEGKAGRGPEPDAPRRVLRELPQPVLVAQRPGGLHRQQGVVAGLPGQGVQQHRQSRVVGVRADEHHDVVHPAGVRRDG